MASLELEVIPGHDWQPGEPIDTQKLAATAEPVVKINGPIPAEFFDGAGLRELIGIATSGLISGRKNFLLNGNFDFWQRGTSFNTQINDPDHLFTADHWGVPLNLENRTIDRVTAILGLAYPPGNHRYHLRWTQGGPVNVEPSYLSQRIEGVSTLMAKKVTLSTYIYSTIACNIGLRIFQHFGFGGSPSAGVATSLVFKPVTANTWQRIEGTFDVPSVLGKTIGTTLAEHGDWLEVRFIVPNDTAFEMHFYGAQLEEGEKATPLEIYHLASEEVLLQRYYEIVNCRLASAFTESRPVMYYKVNKRYIAQPRTLYIAGDAEPYPGYWTPLDEATAEQGTTHAQTRGTFYVDAELRI